MPIPDRVREVLPHIDPAEPLLPALERELRRATAVTIPPDAWQPERVPAHLRATFRVLDDQQRPLAQGKDLTALRAQVAPQARASLARAASTFERTGQTAWTFGTLPATVEVQRGGHVVTAFPALVDEGQTVGVRVVPTEAEASRLSWRGARRLLVLTAGSPVRQVVKAGAADPAGAAVQPGRRDPGPGRRLRGRRGRRADRRGRRTAARPGGVRGPGRRRASRAAPLTTDAVRRWRRC